MGSWVEELASGKWQARYTTPDGKKRSAGTFVHKRAAEKAAAVKEDEVNTLGWRDPRAGLKTWGEWCGDWWDTRAVEPGTLLRDASARNLYLTPRWGTVPLIEITRHDVKVWAASLRKKDLAPATIRRHVALFAASLSAAVDAEIIVNNAAYRIKLVGGQTDVDRYLTHTEASLLIAQFAPPVQNRLDEALVSTFLGTGMRWGELVGLQTKRVDMARRTIRIAEVWDSKMNRLKAYPKGRRIREVPLPEWVIPHLEPLIAAKTQLVFDAHGSAVQYANWNNRNWAQGVERSGIGHVRIHDLRHTYASWLLQGGVSLAEVGRLLGHVSPETTQRYAHLSHTASESVLAALQNPRA